MALLVGAALAGAVLVPLLKGAIGSPDALKLAAYGAITCATVAALLGALADRGRRTLARVLLDIGLSPGPWGLWTSPPGLA